MHWQIRNKTLSLDRTLLMGVLNLTPDSFSDGGKFTDPAKAVTHALELECEGADILDLGAESSRPGAEEISLDEELRRLLPVLRELRCKTEIPISIDTTKPEVARACLAEGAHIINDISGLKDNPPSFPKIRHPRKYLGGDPDSRLKPCGNDENEDCGNDKNTMADVVREFGAGLILMHRRGNAKTMQSLTSYEDVTENVLEEISESVERALAAGIRREQLAIDPGLGFAKTGEQNFELLRNLERFHKLNLPILIGASRKSFLGTAAGRPVEEREYAHAAVCAVAVIKGVHILRVHDVRSARDAVKVAESIFRHPRMPSGGNDEFVECGMTKGV